MTDMRALPIHLLTLIVLLMPGSPGQAEIVEHRDIAFHVYRLDASKETLELHLSEGKGKPNTFTALRDRLAAKNRKVTFAMNSGIFEGNFMPSGLHIANGKTITKLNLDDFVKEQEGQFTPNFFLKPNGVFFIRKDKSAGILESERYSQSGEKPILATQSGPLLVQNNQIHSAFNEDSESKRSRNGVGVTADGEVILVCTVMDRELGMSNLYHFAEFFRDKLKCPNALYLDGAISYVYIEGETTPMRDTNLFAGILTITEPLE